MLPGPYGPVEVCTIDSAEVRLAVFQEDVLKPQPIQLTGIGVRGG